jgi:hypothetical protein
MKRVTRVMVVLAVLIGVVAVGTPAQALPTCSSKVGTYLSIGECGGRTPTVSVEFINGASPTGHLQIWDYYASGFDANGPTKAYGNDETQFFSGEDWVSLGVRTCVSFWVSSGGRWHGEIDCVPSSVSV